MAFSFIQQLPYDLVLRLNEMVPVAIWKKRMKNVNQEHKSKERSWEVLSVLFKEDLLFSHSISPFLYWNNKIRVNFMNRRDPPQVVGAKGCWKYNYELHGNRHPTLKVFQQYADEHGVSYKKSWNKWKLGAYLFDCPESWLRATESSAIITEEERRDRIRRTGVIRRSYNGTGFTKKEQRVINTITGRGHGKPI